MWTKLQEDQEVATTHLVDSNPFTPPHALVVVNLTQAHTPWHHPVGLHLLTRWHALGDTWTRPYAESQCRKGPQSLGTCAARNSLALGNFPSQQPMTQLSPKNARGSRFGKRNSLLPEAHAGCPGRSDSGPETFMPNDAGQ